EGLKCKDDLSVGGCMMGQQPGVTLDEFRSTAVKQVCRWDLKWKDFHDARDLDVSDRPVPQVLGIDCGGGHCIASLLGLLFDDFFVERIGYRKAQSFLAGEVHRALRKSGKNGL